MRRDICNWQVNEASLVRAQMWSGICYTKPWQVKQVVSCPLKQLRTPPALLWAQRPQCDSWEKVEDEHDSCSFTCNVTFAVSKKERRARNSQPTGFSVYWAEFPDAALGVFDTKMYKSQLREESSHTDMAVVPGEQPKQTPREQRYPPGDQQGCSSSDRPGISSHVSHRKQCTVDMNLWNTHFLQFHWKSWMVGTVATSYWSGVLRDRASPLTSSVLHAQIHLMKTFKNKLWAGERGRELSE